MAEKGLKEADISDAKPIIETVENEEKKFGRGEIPLTEFSPVEPDKAPDFSVLPDFMRKICKIIAEFPGLSVDELAAKLDSNKHIIWSNLARLSLKDKTYQRRLIRANIIEAVITARKEQVGNKRLKVYFLSEKYKGEFVK